MSYTFSQKTSDSCHNERTIKKNGSTLIVTVFLFLGFGTLALGIILLSQAYLKIGGHEKHSRLLDYASENGIKEGFQHLVSAAEAVPLPAVITEERYVELRADALGAGSLLAEEAMGLRFPIQRQAQEERMIWLSRADCQPQNVFEQEGFILARFVLPVQSEGRLTNLTVSRSSSLDVKVEVLAGHVPLSTIPFLLEKDLSPEEQVDFNQENDIALLPYPGEFLPPRVSFSDASLIPQDATPLLEKALDIEIFRPQDISAAQLRSALGLEESEEPVPEGVYLIRNDIGLGGIYVQGDVKELIVAIEGEFQVLSFRMEGGVWLLKFCPSLSRTVFLAPEGEEDFDLVPLPVVIIDGEVLSLGGGYIDAGGEIRLLEDQEVPSLLSGINLTLVASGEITITSHLLQQGITWQDGIPYVKSDQTQLVIFSIGRDLWGEGTREGGIAVSRDAPQDLKVQASLTAGGGGLKLDGEDTTLQLMGSIQATDYDFAGRRLNLIPWLPQAAADGLTTEGPKTAQPVLFVFRFGAAAWKEY